MICEATPTRPGASRGFTALSPPCFASMLPRQTGTRRWDRLPPLRSFWGKNKKVTAALVLKVRRTHTSALCVFFFSLSDASVFSSDVKKEKKNTPKERRLAERAHEEKRVSEEGEREPNTRTAATVVRFGQNPNKKKIKKGERADCLQPVPVIFSFSRRVRAPPASVRAFWSPIGRARK